MPIRPKAFLAFALICITPLLAVSLIGFRHDLKSSETLIREGLEQELTSFANNFESLLRERQTELTTLAATTALRSYVRHARSFEAGESSNPDGFVPSSPRSSAAETAQARNAPEDVRAAVLQLFSNQPVYSTIACFDENKRLLFVAQRKSTDPNGPIVFRTKEFLPNEIMPDERVWTSQIEPLCTIQARASFGRILRCTTSVTVGDEASHQRAAMVADLAMDSLLADAAWRSSLPGATRDARGIPPAHFVVAVDSTGTIVYHTNEALKFQPVDKSLPEFANVADSIIANHSGTRFFRSPEGDDWLAAYVPVKFPALSLAVARNYSLALGPARHAGEIEIILAILLGLAMTTGLAIYYQRKTESIARVTQGVVAIAGGRLDQRIEVRSSDDVKLLADNVNLMTERLREQIAREAETRQFQSFVKLSAMLTHDLKNAIAALSLIVGNLGKHFDKEEFRADAMKALSEATEKLKGLVERLSSPVMTLSGEFKRPQPTDLVPIIKRVTAFMAEPVRGSVEIEVRLPQAVLSLVESERIEKVFENLILNALEAMGTGRGKLIIEAGQNGEGEVFFSISDTGPGMSARFIEERLFHPFVTTKKNGVGLGLYTCREVVRANGGSIDVQSEEGVGTTFRVMLPSASL